MKTSEQMTMDVLKRRDEEIKARKPLMVRRITAVAVPCAAALAVTAVTAASINSAVDNHRGNSFVSPNYMGDFLANGTAELGVISDGSEEFCTSYPQNFGTSSVFQTDAAAVTREPEWFLKNPNAGKYVFRTVTSEYIIDDLKVIEPSYDFNELSDPKYTFIPYPNEGLNKYYNIEFDRFSRLHPDWSESHDRQTGVYYLEESDAMMTSIELKCDLNTLNYTTPNGAEISVTAQRSRFIPETVSSTSVERPKTETNIIYDENGNEIGAFTPGYDPGNTAIKSGSDSIETEIYTNPGKTEFLVYVDMGTWVKLYAKGISETEFLKLIDEYTENPQTNAETQDIALIGNEDDVLKNSNARKASASMSFVEDIKIAEDQEKPLPELDPNDFIPQTMEELNSYYDIEFDLFGKLHADWEESHEPLGINIHDEYGKFDEGISSREIRSTRNTLNYTTPNGAKISVTAQLGRFIPDTDSSAAVEKPKTESSFIYDADGNVIGATTPAYVPENNNTASNDDDYAITATFADFGNMKFLTYIDMRLTYADTKSTWVKICSEGLSFNDHMFLITEYRDGLDYCLHEKYNN